MDQAALYRGSVATSQDVLAQELPDGETIFLHLGTEEYLGLDSVGTTMYHRLVEAETVQAAHDRLLEEFDVTPERLRVDLSALVDQLLSRGIVELRGA